jgi:cation diffusion facilitator CzcD-associated flavoprotein CzcO
MTREETDVAIIGAGPNGVAVAAQLEASGIERRIFGFPFATWRDRMPNGMLLRSEPYASDVAAPVPGFRVRDYCLSNGLPYVERKQPLSRETFLRYADWFTRTLVADVEQVHVTSLRHEEGRFRLSTEDGGQIRARRVIVATGIMPFAFLPEVLRSLPAEMVSHSSAHSDLTAFRGKHVGVIGGGQSALETAALLHEEGAEVELIAREEAIMFNKPVPETTSFWTSLRKPVNPLCETWHCLGYYALPDAFWALPERLRVEKARTVLGPSGAWWLQQRLEGRVPLRLGYRVVDARPVGERACLALEGERREEVTYDHVIAGTGYNPDLDRLDFISSELRRSLKRAGGVPALSRSFESSVPGLFFVGSPAAPSLGPSMRFISGTRFTARRLARRMKAGKGRADVGAEAPQRK